MSRSIHFPAIVFLLLFALLLLFSGQLSHFSVPRSIPESGKAIEGAAVEKAALIEPDAVTERELQPDLSQLLSEVRRFRLSRVGLSHHPVEIEAAANDQRPNSGIDTALNKITPKHRGTLRHQKDPAHPPRSVKSVSRNRPAANLIARIHCWLVSELRLPHTTGGRSNKNRIRNRHLAAAGSKVHGRSEFHHRSRKVRAEPKTFVCSR